mgnify:CR=1 FL=1
MFNAESWQEIFQSISANKLRTFLSGFTVALGIFIFVILFGMGNGLKNGFQAFFVKDATNLFFVSPGRTSEPFKGFKSNRQIEFSNDDIRLIKQRFPFYVDYISPRLTRSKMVKYQRESNRYSTIAITPPYQQAVNAVLKKGRFINRLDLKHKSKKAVIGHLVEKDLFKEQSALGKYIAIGESVFQVVGVFYDDGGDNEERKIYIPYTTLQSLEKNTDKIDDIVIAFSPNIGYAGAMFFEEKVRELLHNEHSISAKDQTGIHIRNVADTLKKNNQFAMVLQIIVSFVGVGTLIAGIIGISNIMVFVVKERTKELGIRKALGATPRDVISMILKESIFITISAGYIGLLAGSAVLNMIGNSLDRYFISNPSIGGGLAISATLVLVFAGAAAGYLPAKKASRIKPIVALQDS